MPRNKSKSSSKKKSSYQQKSIFTKISELVFINTKVSLVFFVALIAFGAVVYTNIMRREGFPSVNIPVSVGGGVYFAEPEDIDEEVTRKIFNLIKDVEGIKEVDGVKQITTFAGNEKTFNIAAELASGYEASDVNVEIEKIVKESGQLPEGARFNMVNIDAARFMGEYDILTSVYGEGQDFDQLSEKAEKVIAELEEQPLVKEAEVINQYRENDTNPEERFQFSFSRAYVGESNEFIESATIGIIGTGGSDFDLFDLEEQVNAVLAEFNEESEGVTAVNTADITRAVSRDISSLQSNVLTGAVVVALISALMISVRVSILTSVFIVSVLLVTITIMWLLGFSLNVITLFSLILALGLFVDDATIIAEAIYAKKDTKKSPLEVVQMAINSIGTASFAGTLTTILVFSPLLFITGILGDFIFQMPMTVIVALLTSFFLSITLIPLLANYTMLADDKEPRKPNVIGVWLGDMIEKLRTQTGVGVAWGVTAVALSFALVFMSFGLFARLDNDIFPSGKDGDDMIININYPDNTSIEQAQTIAAEVDSKVAELVGEYIVRGMYFLQEGGLSNANQASMALELVHYGERDITSVAIMDNINQELESYSKAKVSAIASNGGPPEVEFPFLVQVNVKEGELEKSKQAAESVAEFLNSHVETLANGNEVKVTKTEVVNVDAIVRVGDVRQIEVRAKFDADASTGATSAFTDAVKAEFSDEKMAAYGLSNSDLGFDLGQDSDFEESFSFLPVAALIALLIMFALLALQFFSVMKPLLIFVALPFSLFGIAFGLYITNNPLSFFSMIGIIGLIGIAVNNTILLVDNATHHQKSGLGPVGAVAQAMRERFRPLAATTLTTIAALLPLALSNPFWESLSVTIMAGLASSTLLVVLAFPYYYILPQAIWRGAKIVFKSIKKGA